MSEFDKSIRQLRERLRVLRQGFDEGMAAMLDELGAVKVLADEMESLDKLREQHLAQLREQTETQAGQLEVLNSELAGKQDLFQALRQQLDSASAEAAALREELETASSNSAEEMAAENAGLEALKSELEARKSMIRSLRVDAERADALQLQLDAKRETIAVLEESINRHVATIAALTRSAGTWKRKYQAAKGRISEDPDETLGEMPEFTETEVEALKALEAADQDVTAKTISIDMRGALEEARRQKERSRNVS